MKKKILTLLLLTTTIAVQADDTSHRATAAAFLEAQRTDQLVAIANEQRKALYANQVKEINSSPETRKLVDAYLLKISDIISRAFDWKKIRGEYVAAYSAVYTEEELKAMTAFFLSPAGQALMDKQAQVNALAVKDGRANMDAVQTEIFNLRAKLAEDYQVIKKREQEAAKAGKQNTTPDPMAPGSGLPQRSPTVNRNASQFEHKLKQVPVTLPVPVPDLKPAANKSAGMQTP